MRPFAASLSRSLDGKALNISIKDRLLSAAEGSLRTKSSSWNTPLGTVNGRGRQPSARTTGTQFANSASKNRKLHSDLPRGTRQNFESPMTPYISFTVKFDLTRTSVGKPSGHCSVSCSILNKSCLGDPVK